MFERKWALLKEGSHIADDIAPHYLFQCADGLFGDSLLKTDTEVVNKDLHEVLRAMKDLVLIPIAMAIMRSELLEMKQLR